MSRNTEHGDMFSLLRKSNKTLGNQQSEPSTVLGSDKTWILAALTLGLMLANLNGFAS